ncbi:MAG TPA: ABC transporter permease subunit [Gemmatimonadota bacterium]|nr:ABC transporter permease subunit [Gemmatimonadota bacterium]
MNPGRIRVLIEKDWAELRKERAMIATTLGVTLLLVVVFLAVAIYVPRIGDAGVPDRAGQLLLLRQLVLLLLMVPEFATMAIATYSVIGEKRARSLEPLLATPITTAELLAAKFLSAAIPGIALTWLAFGVSALAVWGLTSADVARLALSGDVLLLVFVIAPLVALLGAGLGVIASSRASDPRSAQQIGVLVIVPLVGLLILQLEGLLSLTPDAILAGAAVLAAGVLLLLRIGVALFRRETILTRWR